MTPNPQAYAEACRLVERAVDSWSANCVHPNPDYLIARAAFLRIRDHLGTARAAELAHALGHELNGGLL